MANQPFVLNNLDDVLLACSLYHLMDRNYVKTAHTLEEESGIYFNMQYFEELIMDGRYEDAEFYVLGFTCVSDNENSAKIIFDIKKLKLLEALDDGCNFWAEYMVDTEFGQFKERNEKMYDEAVEVVSDDGAKWKKGFEKKEARREGVEEMKKNIRGNQVLRGKLSLPSRESLTNYLSMWRERRLRRLGMMRNAAIRWRPNCTNNNCPYTNNNNI